MRFVVALVLLLSLASHRAHAQATNYGGTWWNAAESGWAINFAHQGDTISATWFTYDGAGKPWWLYMNATLGSGTTYSGAIYAFMGPPYSGAFTPPPSATQAGSGTITFSSPGNASFSWSVFGVLGTKNLMRMVFATPVPTCVWNAQPNPAQSINYQGPWWTPSESGWLVHFTHQGNVVFGTLFVYDLDGRALWLVASSMTPSSPGVYSGALYRAAGPPYTGPYNPAAVSFTQVGTMTATFANGNNATLDYTIAGTSVSKPITRQVFAGSGTICGFAPASPAAPSAASGAASATVSFTPPSDTGGFPITDYTVTSTPGGITGHGTASPIRVTGLTPGTSYTFRVTASNVVGTSPASAATNGVIAGAPGSDFNLDGHPDILWSNTGTGATYVWHMTGPPPALVGDAFIATIDPSWKVQGVGDFNGDGHPDLVWRNTANGNTYVWYMVDNVFQSDAFLFSLPPEWVIQGVADFNADAHPDFLMRNSNSGVAFAWFFNDNVAIGDSYLFGIDASWKVEAVADMNADLQPDLIFRSMSSGLAFVWRTQWSGSSLSMAGSDPPVFSIDPAWEVAQVADWNGDGAPDFLFRNASSGVVFVWYMAGGALGASEYVNQIDPSWEIVPRR